MTWCVLEILYCAVILKMEDLFLFGMDDVSYCEHSKMELWMMEPHVATVIIKPQASRPTFKGHCYIS